MDVFETTNAFHPEPSVTDEIAALGLPSHVEAMLRDLVAHDPPDEQRLRELCGALRKRDNAMRTGILWYLTKASIPKAMQADAAASVEAVTLEYENPSWPPIGCWTIYPLVLVLTLRSPWKWLVFSFAVVNALPIPVLLMRLRRRLSRPDRDARTALLSALQVLETVTGRIPIGRAARLVHESPEWLRPDAEAAFRDMAQRLTPADAEERPIGSWARLLDLVKHPNADVARSALRALEQAGEGWLVHAVEPLVAQQQADAWSPEQRSAFANQAARTVAELQTRRTRSREELRAEWADHIVEPTASEITDFEAEALRQLRRARFMRRGMILGGSASVIGAFVMVLAAAALLDRPPIGTLMAFLMALCGGFVAILLGILGRPGRGSRIWAWSVPGDPTSVGRLAEWTKLLMPDVTQEAKAGLVMLLPDVRAHHRYGITPYQRQCLLDLLTGEWALPTSARRPSLFARMFGRALHRISDLAVLPWLWPMRLDPDEHEELAVGILRALMHIGDGADLNALRNYERRTRNNRHRVVSHAAAVECIAIVEERARTLSDAERLLRPAPPPDDAMLLRPASGDPSTPPEMLVRPVGEVTPDLVDQQPCGSGCDSQATEAAAATHAAGDARL